MKKYWKETIIVAMITLVVIPLIVAFMLNFRLICTDTSNEWIGFWGGYLGSIIGGIISGCITLLVMVKTFEDGKKERRLEFCNEIVEDCTRISNSAAQVTLITQKFLQTALEKYYDNAILHKNAILDEIWKTIIKLEAKRNSYAFAQEIYEDLTIIAKHINSFCINDLNYTDEREAEETVKSLTESNEYKKVYNDCYAAANGIQNIFKNFAEHMRSFYSENTKNIL